MDAKPSILKRYGGSLFYRLLASFAVVIVLLISVNMLTYVYFRSTIREEIVKNSSLNLSATVENYEKHIKLVRGLLISFYFNDKTEILKNNTLHFNYSIAKQEQLELQKTLNNPMLYLQNVAYYFSDIDYVIDKDGTREAGSMFGNLYRSPHYPASFWKAELAKPFTFSMYPSTEFTETNAFYSMPLGSLTPLVVKTFSNPKFGIIGFLDSAKMYDSFHQVKTNSAFYILDQNEAPLFAMSELPEKPIRFDTMEQKKGYLIHGTDYYFYEKGPESGFTYVNVIPFAAMTQQIFHLNLITITVLLLSVLIGIAVSVFFSARFHNPISAILRSIQQVNPASVPQQSPIKEFNMINEKLHDLFKVNENIHKDLHYKNSLLQQYVYLCKAKMIESDVQNIHIPSDTEKPFRLILFHLLYKERFVGGMGMDQNRASTYIKEFINSLFSRYWEALTLQMEKDQVLIILFGDDSEQQALSVVLRQVADILSLDKRYCDVTIAVSPVYRDPLAFNPAFEFVIGLLKQRRLGEGVQIISAKEALPDDLLLTPSEEKEFTANLVSGNDGVTVPLIRKALKKAAGKQASVFQMHEFSKDIVNLAVKSMYSMNVRISLTEDNRPPSALLYECRTLEQLQSFFEQFLTRSAEGIRQKKTENDYIASFVTDYVNRNFGSDLSLDALADKLNITGAYLSTYYKEKTGVNVSDYVNTVRMNKAMELLRDTDLKVQDIAQLIGYYSIASFNRMFKKHTGFTPGEYRRASAGS
ncbi:hypothetical protein J31TS4_19690 [Paenibacillus sp. J31TS4]|uniref:helix-turn-helix domain-containing protein n=1 Tax=Paenibacillus sp. J31TS4 TaxID=2807195 RepID=UPI001B1DD7D8|nr:AraC family transcriptional regulator [Paenibacillus sp. J31TS4]GIP38689.1 hypothetical protein J31TS4_19690 [Paenibacillus sp. J31TS4]